MKRSILTPRRRLPAAALVVALPFALTALAVEPSPKPRKAPPPPRGVVIGAADVCVVARSDHGDPAGIPFASVSGAYRLTGFPYARAGRSASVLYFREGYAPQHVSVARPAVGAPGPRLGKTALVPLPAGEGCVAGILVSRDAGGILRYRTGVLTATPLGAEEPPARIRTRQDGFFQRALPPGRYRLAFPADGEAQRVEVGAGETTFVIFEGDSPQAPREGTDEHDE